MTRVGTWAILALLATAPCLAAEDDAAAPAYVAWVEGVADALGPGGEAASLDVGTALGLDARVFLGEGARLGVVVMEGARAGQVVTVLGRREGRLGDWLEAAAAEALGAPADQTGALREPWDADLGEAPRMRGRADPVRALYPAGKVAAPCGAFVFRADAKPPEGGAYEVRVYGRDPVSGKEEPKAAVRCAGSPVEVDAAAAADAKGRFWWQVVVVGPDGAKVEAGEAVQVQPSKSPVATAEPPASFASPEARSAWHLTRAKALVKEGLHLDAYREYGRLVAAGGGGATLDRERKRLETKIGLSATEARLLAESVAAAPSTDDLVLLTDGRRLEGRVVKQDGAAVFVEVLGTRYRLERDTVREIRPATAKKLPSAAPFVGVASEHYAVQTNAGRDFGEEVLARLEALHDAFVALLGKDLGARRARGLKAQVFGDSTDFRAFLAQEFPAESQGQGFYAFHKTTLYVYRSFDKGQETTWRTLFHEGTHQLLHMACSQNPQANRLPHFWALEAAPCWLEALEWDGKRLTLGDANPVRIANFRRLVKDRQLLPWGDFVRLDQSRFTSDSYEQGHALFWFLMQEDSPKRRAKAVEYLKAVMSGSGLGTPDEDAFGEPLARLAEGVVPWVEATDGKTPPKPARKR